MKRVITGGLAQVKSVKAGNFHEQPPFPFKATGSRTWSTSMLDSGANSGAGCLVIQCFCMFHITGVNWNNFSLKLKLIKVLKWKIVCIIPFFM